MMSRYLLVLALITGLMLGTSAAQAASPAVREMAGIVAHLAHYPSDAEKTRLQAIVSDASSTQQERTIAMAIANLQHRVSAGDADKLKKVTNDMSVPAEVRELAGIVLSINHMPSEADKSKLEMMMK